MMANMQQLALGLGLGLGLPVSIVAVVVLVLVVVLCVVSYTVLPCAPLQINFILCRKISHVIPTMFLNKSLPNMTMTNQRHPSPFLSTLVA